MSEIDVGAHVSYALRNTPLKRWPFPHIYVENVFPASICAQLLQKLRNKTDYLSEEGKYHGRTFGSTDDFPEIAFMQTPEFLSSMCAVFFEDLQTRFKGQKLEVYSDLRFVRDGAGYHIGPHTDARWKIASFLFYLPQTDAFERHGTSLYLPKDRAFRCVGGPHHKFEHFDRITTAPYRVNTCLAFLKTDNSFHGVETIHEPLQRDVLLFNIYNRADYDRSHPPKKDAAP